MLVALLNGSRYMADKLDAVGRIAEAVSLQLRLHAAPAWDRLPWSCAFYGNPALTPSSAYRIWLLDDADVAGALGYHDQDPDGKPYGKVFVSPILRSGGAVSEGADSVSVTVSHEALELFGDPEANLWAEMPDGRCLAVELCDPCEGDAYQIAVGGQQIAVSDFVLPPYFDGRPEAQRFDFLGLVRAPWEVRPGGYLIIRDGQKVDNVWGAGYPDWRLPGKRHPAARTCRRWT